MAEPGWVEQVGGVKQSHTLFLSVYGSEIESNCGLTRKEIDTLAVWQHHCRVHLLHNEVSTCARCNSHC